MRGKRVSNIGDRNAIGQLGGDAAGTTPVRQVGDGVVDTGFRASDDHRAAAVVDDIDRDLSSYAGATADDNDLLAFEMHVRLLSWYSVTAPAVPLFFVSTTRRIRAVEEFGRQHADGPVKRQERSHRQRRRPRCPHASGRCPCTELLGVRRRRAWCMWRGRGSGQRH